MQRDDYLHTPANLHLLLQLHNGSKSLTYLKERLLQDETSLRNHVRNAKELGLISEISEDETNLYELTEKGKKLIKILEDNDGFDKQAYISKRRELLQIQQRRTELNKEIETMLAKANNIVSKNDI